jgi:hypothetical protein
VLQIQIKGRDYEFIVDSGANLSLVQPYVGEGCNTHVDYLFRGVTGNLLKTQGSQHITFQLGRRTYRHNFIISPFSMKRDGIIGLDVLRALEESINFETNQLSIGEEIFALVDVRLCAASPGRTRKMSLEVFEPEVGHPRARERPSEIMTPPSHVFASRTADAPVPKVQHDRSVEPQLNSLEKRPRVQVVLASCITVEPRSMVIARGKIVNEQRESVLKTDTAKAIFSRTC